MPQSRFEIRVGLFMLVGLVLLAALVVLFSKGVSLGWDVYHLRLQAANIGGLKPRAAALMAGVQVGSVSDIQLAASGTNVFITLQLDRHIVIRRGSRFVIEQAGFLGDQYVSILATNRGEALTNNEVVPCEEPFNMLEVARSASGLLVRFDDTARKLDAAMEDLRKYVLNEQTLSNFSTTVGTLRDVSDHALTAMDSINGFVETNAEPARTAVSNLVYMSEQMRGFSTTLNDLAATHRAEISTAVQNVKTSTETLKSLLDGVQAGKGLAGAMLKDDQLAANVSLLAHDLAVTSSNLAVTTSNLNQRGLWGILWKPKPPRTNAPAQSLYPGRSPFN